MRVTVDRKRKKAPTAAPVGPKLLSVLSSGLATLLLNKGMLFLRIPALFVKGKRKERIINSMTEERRSSQLLHLN
jgi:hypothetical protein